MLDSILPLSKLVILIVVPVVALAFVLLLFAYRSRRRALYLTKTITKSFEDQKLELERVNKELVVALNKVNASLIDKESQQKAILNILEDVDAEKEKTEIEKEKMTALIEGLSDGVALFDTDNKAVLVNSAMVNMTGLPKEGFLLNELTQLFSTGKVDLEGRISAALSSGSAEVIEEMPFVSFVYQAVILPVKKGEKGVYGGAIVLHDITHLKEVDKAKSEFVSLASHQLRTPLSSINWYTEMLLAGDAGPINEEQRGYLDEIYQGNQRMVDLVNSLLNVSRLELGTFMIEPKPTDLPALLNSVVNEQKISAENRKISVALNIREAGQLKEFMADDKLLRMVFQNLLSNSIKYTQEGGKIEMELAFDDEGVLFRIADNGYGIPLDQQNRIFTKIFRASNVREKDTEGTGLGLYIVKSIVDQSNGKIWFKSEGAGGSTFFVRLPKEGMKVKTGNVKLSG